MCLHHTFAAMGIVGKITAVTALVLGVVACNYTVHQPESGVFDLRRLAGRWEFLDKKTHQIEEWTLAGEKELRGRGFVLEKGDTTFIEFLTIRETNGVLTYFAQVSDLGAAEVVPFSLTSQTKDKLEFSNTAQDFPQKIVYELKSDSTIQAYLEGPRDGQKIRVVFDFVKQS